MSTVSALDDGTLGHELITDLDELKEFRQVYFETYGKFLALQDSEREAGLTEADIRAQIART